MIFTLAERKQKLKKNNEKVFKKCKQLYATRTFKIKDRLQQRYLTLGEY